MRIVELNIHTTANAHRLSCEKGNGDQEDALIQNVRRDSLRDLMSGRREGGVTF